MLGIVEAGEVLALAVRLCPQLDLDGVRAPRVGRAEVDILEVAILGQLFARVLRTSCQPLVDPAGPRRILVGAYPGKLTDLLVIGVVDASGIVAVVTILDAQRDLDIVLAGAATNWCIRATAYGALDRGYDLTLIKDAHTTGTIELVGGARIEAESVVNDLNVAMKWLSYPGRRNSTATAEEVVFAAASAPNGN